MKKVIPIKKKENEKEKEKNKPEYDVVRLTLIKEAPSVNGAF